VNKPSFSKEKDIYLSSKAGPNGKATLSAMESLLLYDYPTMQAILNLTDKEGGDYFCSSYTYAFNNLDKFTFEPKALGKLSFIKDPEAKLRIIAIVDYYSQLFLKPIHESIFSLLKRLPCDRTFTQNPLHK